MEKIRRKSFFIFAALGVHLPIVLAACNAVIFAVLAIMEWRVHPIWLIVFILSLNLAVITLMRVLVFFRYDPGLSLRCFIVLIAAGAINFYFTLGLLPALLATSPICAILFVSRIIGRRKCIEKIPMPPRLAMSAFAAVGLVYFIPVANMMSDHTLLGSVDVDCVNEKCVRSLRQGDVYEINADRYRGPVAADARTGANPRLMFLGDSSTFGFGVPYRDTYPALVGQSLKNRGYENVAILNAAVPGHTEVENLVRFQKYSHWRPTHVFIMGGWHFRNLSRSIHESENLLYMRHVRGLAFLTALMTHQMFHSAPEAENESLRLWTMAMGTLLDKIQKSGGIGVVLEYPAPDTNEILIEAESRLADNRGIAFIRLRDRFAQSEESLLLFDKCHPNDKGHRVIAEAIVEWLVRAESRAENPDTVSSSL